MLETKALKEDWDLMNKTGDEDGTETSEDAEENEDKMDDDDDEEEEGLE
ncbi:MAG: hypothetical protein AAB454_00835 [Patescibacteria group bacterium]